MKLWVSVAAAACAFVGTAHAGTVYDTSLADPPGVYFGTGNSGTNQGWTVNTSNGVELGLTTIHRQVGSVLPTSTNIYNVPTGPDTPFSSTRAYWNFDFSVNLQAAGLTIGQVTPTLSIYNAGNGTHISGNPLLAFPDTQSFGPGGVSPVGALPTDYAFQNSENLTFGQFAALGFDMNLDDTYLITLSLLGPTGASLGMVKEVVVVGAGAATPLPAALPLFASGAGVFGLLGWRKRRKANA